MMMMIMILVRRIFSDPYLVGTDSIIGRLLMERIPNGATHLGTLGGLGIGDIGLKKSMNMRVNAHSQIWPQIGWPLD